jgi:hypothetical protein
MEVTSDRHPCISFSKVGLAARLLFFTVVYCIISIVNVYVIQLYLYNAVILFPELKEVCHPCVTGRFQTTCSWTADYRHLIYNMAIRPAASGCFKLSFLCEDNNNQTDLQERINNANKTYFMLQKLFENKNISKKVKLRLKNTIIDKTLTCTSETGTPTKRDGKQMNIFEREVYRRI